MTQTNAPEPEREKFEAWGLEFFNYGFKVERDDAGDYLHDGTDTAWFAWQARAALGTPTIAVQPDLHAQIMNLPCGGIGWVPDRMTTPERAGYLVGHRDARHAAAELASALASSPAVQAVPEGWRLVQDATVEERSWPEDSTHENGNYWNDCCHCQRMFFGHKRRVVCKSCASAPQAPAPEPKTNLLDQFLAEAKRLGIERFTPEMVEAIRVRSGELDAEPVHPAGLSLAEHATLSESDPLPRETPTNTSGRADPLYAMACAVVRAQKRAAISTVQRHLQIGYNRAAALLEAMVGDVIAEMPPTTKLLPASADSSQQGCVPAATAAGSDVEDEKGES